MLINFSNHPSELWSRGQMSEAKRLWAGVVDIHFPMVDPEAGENEIHALAVRYADKILEMLKASPGGSNAVHIMGELTLCFQVVQLLKENSVTCVVSTSLRVSQEEDGVKISEFKFVKFRKY